MGLAKGLAAIAVGVAGAGLVLGADVDRLDAANTTAEYLVDSDGDGLADSRPFAGVDRYGTAVRLARQVAADLGGLGAVRSAIVVSGRSPVDAAVAVGLAGVEQAPLLLTPPGELHRGVAAFLDEHGVERVFVVGGPAAVSDRVASELEALASGPEVVRLWGSDRYSTAAAVASQVGGTARWCTSEESAALLVDGDGGSLAAAVAAGPLAAGLGLPVLLSSVGGLPESTAQFVRSADIDHVVVVGDPARIPESIESELAHAGAATATRISGTDPPGIAAAVADVMAGDCAWVLETAADMVALTDPDAPTDGLAAAALLAAGIDGSGALPLLFAGQTLPEGTAARLSSVPIEIDLQRVHLRIVALGGYGAVSEAAMAEALAAGATSGPFSVTLEAKAGERTFTVTLSDALNAALPNAEGHARDMLYVNGIPALLDPTFPLDIVAGEPCAEPRSFLVNLAHPLDVGDVVELIPTDVRFGARGDRRLLSGAKFVVTPLPSDTERPAIEVVAPIRSGTVRIVAGDDSGAEGLQFDPAQITVHSPIGTAVSTVAEFDAEMLELFDLTTFDVDLVAPEGYTRPVPGGGEQVPPGGTYLLQSGDRVFARSATVTDAAAHPSRSHRSTVSEPRVPLRALSVQIAPVPRVGSDSNTGLARATFGGALRIAVRGGSELEGTAGNAWEVRFSRRGTHDPDAEPVEVDIAVSDRDQLVSIRFASGIPTVGQLAERLNAHTEFSSRFEASAVGSCTAHVRPVDLSHPDFDGATALGGGAAQYDVTIRFSGPVREYLSDRPAYANGDQARELLDDILAGLIDGYTTSAAAEAAGDAIEVEAPTPYDQARFRYSTTNPARDATAERGKRTVVDIRGGLARSHHHDDPSTDTDESLSVETRLRPEFP